MEIKIIDNSGVLNVLEFEYNQKGIEIDKHLIFKRIKDVFTKSFSKIYFLFSNFQNLVVEVNLEQSLKNDLAVYLARYDNNLSNNDKFVFYFYHESLQFFIEEIYSQQLKAEQTHFTDIEDTVIHELFHAADMRIINKTDSIFEKLYKSTESNLGNNISLIKTNLQEDQILYKPIHWTYLYAINRFRNEGVAVLGEKLFSLNKNVKKEIDLKEVLFISSQILNKIHKLTISNFYSTKSSFDVDKEIEILSGFAYEVGHILLLKILSEKEPSINDLIQKAIDYLFENESDSLDLDEVQLIFDKVLTLDLTDYITGILNYKFEELNDSLVSKENVFEYCSLLQNESNEYGLKTFTTKIALIGLENSEENFIQIMKETVCTKMSNEEITTGYDFFLTIPADENIIQAIKEQSELLYQKAIKEQNLIAQWALTYLLDDEDLIHDRITFLGWQDDWLVLDAALRIIYQ